MVCVSNLKQVDLSLRCWSGMNQERFPMQVSTNEGGTAEWVQSGLAYPHFAVLSNELPALNFFYCPADAERKVGSNYASLGNENISYFVVPESSEAQPKMWLLGDRNLASGWSAPRAGRSQLGSNSVLEWTSKMHGGCGNIALADGSVLEVSNSVLNQVFSNTLQSHYRAGSNASFHLLFP
jgi:hypothetical protein